MKKNLILLSFMLFAFLSNAQESSNIMYLKDKKCNIGVRVGFNSSLPIIKSITTDGDKISSFQQHYKVGYLTALSLRINFNKFFFNPTLSWYHSESEIDFSLPNSSITSDENIQQPQTRYNNTIKSTTSSLDIPILIGYDIVKSNPYRLSIILGPKFKYYIKEKYDLILDNTDETENISKGKPYGINMVAGLDVTIGRLFLDFTYEFGVTQKSSSFEYTNTENKQTSILTYTRRTNSLSFALGIFF